MFSLFDIELWSANKLIRVEDETNINLLRYLTYCQTNGEITNRNLKYLLCLSDEDLTKLIEESFRRRSDKIERLLYIYAVLANNPEPEYIYDSYFLDYINNLDDDKIIEILNIFNINKDRIENIVAPYIDIICKRKYAQIVAKFRIEPYLNILSKTIGLKNTSIDEFVAYLAASVAKLALENDDLDIYMSIVNNCFVLMGTISHIAIMAPTSEAIKLELSNGSNKKDRYIDIIINVINSYLGINPVVKVSLENVETVIAYNQINLQYIVNYVKNYYRKDDILKTLLITTARVRKDSELNKIRETMMITQSPYFDKFS